MKTKIIQITSGRGPVECCWVVAQVLKHIIEDLKKSGITYTILHREEGTENRTLQSATIQLHGKALESFLKNWLGTVQWIGKSSFRKFQKRKNWFIGIYEVKTSSQPTILNENGIKFQAIRRSGPGGQHVNKVSSAVRATHIDTGLQVLVSESRSQHQNKKIALQRLQEKIAAHDNQKLKTTLQSQWENHLNLKRGNPVKIFKGSDFRIKKTTKNYKSKRQKLKNELRTQKWD
ncbi:MAG: peptide chain release factor H [Flavobacteriaceae bacterium]|nr:peptide chain release factor H [Flavobacteriaceae bacterium]